MTWIPCLQSNIHTYGHVHFPHIVFQIFCEFSFIYAYFKKTEIYFQVRPQIFFTSILCFKCLAYSQHYLLTILSFQCWFRIWELSNTEICMFTWSTLISKCINYNSFKIWLMSYFTDTTFLLFLHNSGDCSCT